MITQCDFEKIQNRIFATRQAGEHFFLGLSAEDTQFIRLNGAKVRQIGCVEDAQLEITLVLERSEGLRKSTRGCTVTGLSWKDGEVIDAELKALRQEVSELPLDPFAEIPKAPAPGAASAVSEARGEMLDRNVAVDALLGDVVRGLNLAGIYAAGPVVRAMANSAGQMHWFLSESFSFDYSIYTSTQRALKGSLAAQCWDSQLYRSEMDDARSRLPILEKPARTLGRGAYRTYLAPAAVENLIAMFSWGCISEAAIQQGDSPLRRVRSGERKFSPLFSLNEDFRGGEVPRFNGLGELAAEQLVLIERGELKSTLVSSRTAQEYGILSNGAATGEALRSAEMGGGTLEDDKILAQLGTGLYLSNLHYLNWSDQPGGRVTGMTRYACFWVENGQIVAPIENLRWDDSLFTLLGSELEALTRTQRYIPNVESYERRGLGGSRIPGALVRAMNFL